MWGFIRSHQGIWRKFKFLIFGAIFLLNKSRAEKAFGDGSQEGVVSDDAYPLM